MATVAAVSGCRSTVGGNSTHFSTNPRSLLDRDILGHQFHTLFKESVDQIRRKIVKKKKKRKLKKKGKLLVTKAKKDKSKTNVDTGSDASTWQAPFVEVCSIPSRFSVFAGVRQSVLEKQIREAVRIFSAVHASKGSDSEDDEEEEEQSKTIIPRIPKIVGVGLCGVFELVNEIKLSHPVLCTKALEALLDILQGQQPEGMRNEPAELIDSLFNLLLELSSATPNETKDLPSPSSFTSLTSVACSCLLSLVVARGDTGKLLHAVSSVLTSPRNLVTEDLKIPCVLTSLQRSIHAVLLGTTNLSDWINTGISTKALIGSFSLNLPEENGQYTMTSDGKWLYIHSDRGNLYKIGTGYSGTAEGHVYANVGGFFPGSKGWLGFAENRLFFKATEKSKDHSASITFSDGDNISTLSSTKEDSFVVRTYSSFSSKVLCVNELPLKLARKSIDLFGWACFDEEMTIHTLAPSLDDEPLAVSAGKDFALMRTASGKVLYYGKAPSLGLKQSGLFTNRWTELAIMKSPKINQFSVGHEGLHALLVTEDGGVFFVGLARRGEDGDQTKGRRQPKPVKPKKMIKVESLNVVYSSCNNGTSALITKDGELYMFGKDTAHCSSMTGLVTDMKDIPVTQVALGKAHAVVLCALGNVYTFGINNKGQCGRDFVTHSKDAVMTAVAGAQDECMVCVFCKECTGFGASCISKVQCERNPGMPCGCGWGDSGCTECGCCKSCAGESKLDTVVVTEVDLLLKRRPKVPELALRRMEERKQKLKTSAGSSSKKSHLKSSKNLDKLGNLSTTEEVTSSDQEKENSKMTSLSPARISILGNFPVTNIACGLHHTVLLLQNGDVMTFGSNQYGQLGLGDLSLRGVPTKVKLPAAGAQVAAGSNHTVVLLSSGLVYTFGSHQKGQLGRFPTPHHDDGRKEKLTSKDALWYAVPGVVPDIGPKFGRRPTWIGASGDQTSLKIDESLINAHNLENSSVFANKNCICLIPSVVSSFKCLLINKNDGSCKSFSGDDQEDLGNHCVCLDPAYNILWSFDKSKNRVQYYNILTSKLALPIQPRYAVNRVQAALNLLACLDTLVLAQELNWKVQIEETNPETGAKVYNRDDFSVVNRFETHGGGWGYSGHSVEALRFMVDTDIILGGFGLFGGRGEYTGKVKVFDIGMDGGEQEVDGELLAETEEIPYECGARQKYPMLFDEPVPVQANRWYVAWARITGPSSDCGSGGQCTVVTDDQITFHFKSSRKSNNGTDVNAGQLPQFFYRVVTTESLAPTSRVDVSEPVYVINREFSLGVTPDCFRSLLYLLEWSWKTFKSNFSKLYSSQETSHTARSITLLDLERLTYIGSACLRLLRTYVNEVYPCTVSGQRNASSEISRVVECIVEMRRLLRHILSDPLPVADPNNHIHERKFNRRRMTETNKVTSMGMTLLEECHTTFVACFHVFYPTSQLKWACLCELLASIELELTAVDGCDRLLAAVLGSLCSPTIKLMSILPVIINSDEPPSVRTSTASGTSALDFNLSSDCFYPLLLDYMTKAMEHEGKYQVHFTFKEVLERLMSIVVKPIELVLGEVDASPSSVLVFNTCAFISAVVAELVSHSIGSDADLASAASRIIYATPSRFTRISQNRTWNTGNGSPDAICFSVDRSWIVIAGVTVYGGVNTFEYELELLDDQTEGLGDSAHRWNSLEIVKGTYGPDDLVGDVVELKFEHPENTKYAIRFRNHGGRTNNGDAGICSIKGPDGTNFTFSPSCLSFNGTSFGRGQIPQILYYCNPQDSESQQAKSAMAELLARKSALFITSSIIKAVTTLLQRAREDTDEKVVDAIASSYLSSELLPVVLAHISPLVTSDPRSAVQVLQMIQEVLPHLAFINNHYQLGAKLATVNENGNICENTLCTTSNHYAIVESDHPYKPSSITTYKVSFPESIKWMLLEFDSQCGTAQNEDSLQLYIPSIKEPCGTCTGFDEDDDKDTPTPYWPVLQRFSGTSNWPQTGIILPGNEVIFSLETASDYVKDEKACFYGFKCLVIGYDWARPTDEGLQHLEVELAYHGGICISSLMKKDLLLPPVSVEEVEDDLELVDDIANQIYKAHSSLFSKGIAVGSPPTVQQALDGVLPYNCFSNERSFLKDFVAASPGTSGGRLARWLQPDSYVEPKHCEISFRDELRCGWTTIITVSTKDQYKDVVLAPNLKVEVKAVPIDKRDHTIEDSNRKMPRISKPDSLSFGGNPSPNISIPYEVTVKDRMRYHAITMMKIFDNYSFEELRYTTPAVKRPSENMMVRANIDGTFSCSWTPGSAGWYLLHVSIDGFEIENAKRVEVKEPPRGVTPPTQDLSKKLGNLPNYKLRKFVGKNSSGLRVRAHPSLQSQQIGMLQVHGVISFIDELHNDDGIWVRLTRESIRACCSNPHVEAWCLQYNQHLGCTLLIPFEEPKSLIYNSENRGQRYYDGVITDSRRRRRAGQHNNVAGPGWYHVVKCGASGHNIRSSPSLKAPPVGMLVLFNQFYAVEELRNSEGVWVKLDSNSMKRYCFNTDGEAWSLAQSRNEVKYLQHENDVLAKSFGSAEQTAQNAKGDEDEDGIGEFNDGSLNWPQAKPFDFSSATFSASLPKFGNSTGKQGVFMFGSPANEDHLAFNVCAVQPLPVETVATRDDSSQCSPPVPPKPRTSSPLLRASSPIAQKWLHNEELNSYQSRPIHSVPPELIGVSVKELVKVLGESRVNGNEATPPHTPPGTPPRRSRSSSPKHVGGTTESNAVQIQPVESVKSGTFVCDSSESSPSSIKSLPASPMLGASPGSSLRRGSYQSPQHSSVGQRYGTAMRRASTLDIGEHSSKSFVQTGTQTSPDSSGNFSIGSSGNRNQESGIRLSPKLPRKDYRVSRQLRSKRERAQSPAPATSSSIPDISGRRVEFHHSSKEFVKTALSPLVAECLRTVFAAFLWHEGIFHDAMACASFLKFHPDLPKHLPKLNASTSQGANSPMRPETPLSKEQKARLRHSVEVSASNFLNIQMNSAEVFARSFANANVNKNKLPKPTAATIREEMGSTSTMSAAIESPVISNATSSGSGTTNVTSHAYAACPDDRLDSDLPPSLRQLLVLWEKLTVELLKIMSQQFIKFSTPIMRVSEKCETRDGKALIAAAERKAKKKKEWLQLQSGGSRGNLFGEAALGSVGAGVERETTCELCGIIYPHPVTYHMKDAHPGCGNHSGGKGYNSGGNFCGGWAGNCGDGGVGGSSWYLVCDRCREKYLKQKRQMLLKNKTKKVKKKSGASAPQNNSKLVTAPLPPMETHLVMKQNATFMLELASANGTVVAVSKRSPHNYNGMPSVEENAFPSSSEAESLNSCSETFPATTFQCLKMLGVQNADFSFMGDNFIPEETTWKKKQSRSREGGTGSVGLVGTTTLHSLAEISGPDDGPESSEGATGDLPKGGRTFHRSISVGTTTRDWNQKDASDGRVIMTRKRNKSSGESIDGSSLLCHPSANLSKLVAFASDKRNSGEILSRPIINFVLKRHDLQSLHLSMRQAVRKAACRAYAMQGLNWFIRSVTQPTALHDLLWFFAASLSPTPESCEESNEDDANDQKDRRSDKEHLEREVPLYEHPLSDVVLAGESARPLVSAFHSLLQSISDLMMLLPMSSALQQMAMRCWCLKFQQSDHVFLHRSHVFSNISKILSRSEEEPYADVDPVLNVSESGLATGVTIECLKDLTPGVDLKATSRPGMLGSLVDNSTETFWESGDEDRNKTKCLTLTFPATYYAKVIYIHIDNCRDLGNKVSLVAFKCCYHSEDYTKLRKVEIESRYAGWVSCHVNDGRPISVKIEFKGPDSTLRIRQVKVLGFVEGDNLQLPNQPNAIVIQQKNCEAETLKVFRLLTSQVFGKLISGNNGSEKDNKLFSENLSISPGLANDQKAERNNDLKEHMVGILFSRSKLTHLQKQVCTHIVQALRVEASRVREEWEALLCSKSLSMEELPKSSDAYCFEMLSMVLALSGSSVGRSYLSQQYSLLRDLLSLLHTGSARVQRQITSLLRRVLPEVSPQTFAQILGVRSLPPTDYSIATEASKASVNEEQESSFDVHSMGILDVFFSCIAKALTVQVKVKGKEASKGITTVTLATSIHPRDYLGARWCLRGCISRKLAEVIIQLLHDMATGKLTEAWASITKGAVAENVLNLTKLIERYRNPSDCLKTPTLWLALASLCVLNQDHVERLSSGQWIGAGDGQQAVSRPFCVNHDDGETLAIILCNVCGNLCAECDRYLHLHRRTHSHQRQVFKEEEEAIKVDLHEGCGRTKLFWILALADSKTLKAMVEFREGTRGKQSSSSAGACRFCGAMGETSILAIGNVCNDHDCQEHARAACSKMLSCGHACSGIKNELICLPCLHGCGGVSSLKQDADDMCMICFTEALSCAPAIQLGCGHVFHLQCCRKVLTKKWTGPRITFGFSLCPICKNPIEHTVLKDLLEPVQVLFEDVRRKALMRLEYEGLHKAEAITTPGARFYEDPAGYAMERYAYYVCYTCQKAYYGGEVRCDIEAGGADDYDPTELVCGGCSDVSSAQMCPKHGADFLEYKCRYCCSVAVFFCFGTTHFCNACHDDFQHVTNIPKPELPHCPAGAKGKQLEGEECPLHLPHPPTGEEFALGCGVCRNSHTF
ncbi:hypothetical protein CHUAL_007142 [Chamberlinius hualienensis]